MVFRLPYAIPAIVSMVVFMVWAQLKAPVSYHWKKHTISELAAQGLANQWIMQTGFIIFGILLMAGLVFRGNKVDTWPLMLYAAAICLSGIFSTGPFPEGADYIRSEARAHSILAQIAGFAFTFAIGLRIYHAEGSAERGLHIIFILAVSALSAGFGLLPDIQGLLQRMLYITSFIWLLLSK